LSLARGVNEGAKEMKKAVLVGLLVLASLVVGAEAGARRYRCVYPSPEPEVCKKWICLLR
jgi:hypothetical protein